MRAIAIVFVGSMLITAAPVAAQPATTGVAEQLFRDGKKLMDAGKIKEACNAFEGSYRKDPAVSTLLNLANCREKNEQYASAWGQFIEAERMTRGKSDQANLNTTARTRAGKLESRLSYLIINVPDEARVDGLTISRNGVEVDPAEWNRDIPVDGGTYTIEGKAPAFEAWSTPVTVGVEKDKQSVNVPRFRELPEQAVAATVAGGTAGAGAGVGPTERPSSFTGKRKAAVGLWAVGAVGLGAGLVFELGARSAYDDAVAATTVSERSSLLDSANQKRLYATVAAGIGGAAVATGVVLWLIGGPETAEAGMAFAPRVTDDSAGLVVTGRF